MTKAPAALKSVRARDPDRLVKLPKMLRFTDRRGAKETEILVAAFHCIAEVGIAATTTRAVASRANINQGAIHYYFSSKDTLLLGVLRALLNNSIANMRAIRDSELSPIHKLNCILSLSASFVREKEEVIVRVALWAHCISKGGAWAEAYRELFDDFRLVIIDIIEDGAAEGVFRTDDCIGAAEIIITGIFGIGMQHAMDPSSFSQPNIGERLAEFYLRILGIEETPREKPSARKIGDKLATPRGKTVRIASS